MTPALKFESCRSLFSGTDCTQKCGINIPRDRYQYVLNILGTSIWHRFQHALGAWRHGGGWHSQVPAHPPAPNPLVCLVNWSYRLNYAAQLCSMVCILRKEPSNSIGYMFHTYVFQLASDFVWLYCLPQICSMIRIFELQCCGTNQTFLILLIQLYWLAYWIDYWIA